MNKILQMLELITQAMEREPGMYKVEIFDNLMYVYDFGKMKAMVPAGIMPTIHTYCVEPSTSYQRWCNYMFSSFIEGLDKTPLLEKGIITQKEYECGEITLNTARQRFGLGPIEDGHKLVTLCTEDEVS